MNFGFKKTHFLFSNLLFIYHSGTHDFSAIGSRLENCARSPHWGHVPNPVSSVPQSDGRASPTHVGAPEHNEWAGSPKRNPQIVGLPSPCGLTGGASPCLPGRLKNCWTRRPCVHPHPVPPQPPHVFPSWNGSAVVIILPLFHCVGQVIYFIVLLSFIGLWVKKGGIRPYWETTMPHLGIQEHSTKHNSDYDTAVTAGCLTPHLLSPLPQIIELLVFSWTQNNSS